MEDCLPGKMVTKTSRHSLSGSETEREELAFGLRAACRSIASSQHCSNMDGRWERYARSSQVVEGSKMVKTGAALSCELI